MCWRHIQEARANARLRVVHGLGGEGWDGGWREVGAGFALKVSQGRFDLLLVPKTRSELSLCSRNTHTFMSSSTLIHPLTHTGNLQTHWSIYSKRDCSFTRILIKPNARGPISNTDVQQKYDTPAPNIWMTSE